MIGDFCSTTVDTLGDKPLDTNYIGDGWCSFARKMVGAAYNMHTPQGAVSKCSIACQRLSPRGCAASGLGFTST